MISFTRMWAMVLRHLRIWRNEPNVLLFNFYWPILDVLVWGYLGAYMQQSQTTPTFHNYELVSLISVLLWQFTTRCSQAILVGFTEELWTANLINLFTLPLRIIEWIGGIVLLSAITLTFTLMASLVAIMALYKVSVITILAHVLIFFAPLFLSGIWLGFTSIAVITTLGKRGTEIGWILGWFFLPFSGAFYPIEVLPRWGQVISSYIPMSYAFKGLREYAIHHHSPVPYLLKGYILGLLYAAIAVFLFAYCFGRSKRQGLSRLID